MTSRAVFLSYASQDAEAARCICEALRAASIEVWFDQSELRGGEEWDRQIRQQIHDCALFVPLISSHTQGRLEGYFRLEWKLAVDRSHLMAAEKTFILPVVVDATTNANAFVPDKFREVQWIRLPGGGTPSTFIERIRHLLSPRLSPAPETRASAISFAQVAAAAAEDTSRKWKPVPLLIAAIIVLAVGYIAIDRFRGVKTADPATMTVSPVAQGSVTLNTISEKSIAVLPFVDMSQKHDQEYFSDGLTEELINLLARDSELHVPARTSSFYFKGRATQVAEIARTLNVTYVLEGSVRNMGNRVRVTAQLIRANSGFHMWSDAYDRDLDDIFKVQADIAESVARQLRTSLHKDGVTHRVVATDGETYSLVLQGRYLARRLAVQDGIRHSIDLFKHAVARDPQYSPAWADLAYAYVWVGFMDPSSKIPEWSALALSATQQALRLDPNNSEAHVALGYAHYWFEFAWAAAQAEFERAYDLDPQNTDAVNALGAVAYNAGEWDKAQGIFRHLLLKDPLYAHGHEWLGQISVALHRYSEAEASYRRADEIYGSSDGLRFAELQLARGRPDDALAIYKKNKDDPTALGGVALSLHKLGRQEESNVAIAELERKYAGVQPCLIAKIHAGRGEPDAAFRWLDRALAQHDMELVHFRGDPDMQTLRSDPRYQVVLHKLHLPE